LQALTSKPAVPSAYSTEVDAEAAGQRIDNFLLRELKGVPRTHVYRLIRSGQVRVNRGRIRASYRLKAGDIVRVPPVSKRAAPRGTPDAFDFSWLEDRILFEDNRILVLDKPAGMAVHGGSGVAIGCIEALRVLRPKQGGMDLVHRLDRATSGCLLVAKRRSALRTLHAVLRENGMHKQYLALLKGAWAHGSHSISEPLMRDRHGDGRRVRVTAEGKDARSDFRVVEHYGRTATLMSVEIPTGRTHQIRVHAAHAGHPVAGDPRYGDFEFNEAMQAFGLKRMFLHAQLLSFSWPDSGEEFTVSAPLPAELREVLDRLSRDV
jgi:23S rRNA pseudouridine955/2504/2580 synthase